MKRRELVETAKAVDRLRLNGAEFWGNLGIHILRIMHELRSKDYYTILDIFHKPLAAKE